MVACSCGQPIDTAQAAGRCHHERSVRSGSSTLASPSQSPGTRNDDDLHCLNRKAAVAPVPSRSTGRFTGAPSLCDWPASELVSGPPHGLRWPGRWIARSATCPWSSSMHIFNLTSAYQHRAGGHLGLETSEHRLPEGDCPFWPSIPYLCAWGCQAGKPAFLSCSASFILPHTLPPC